MAILAHVYGFGLRPVQWGAAMKGGTVRKLLVCMLRDGQLQRGVEETNVARMPCLGWRFSAPCSRPGGSIRAPCAGGMTYEIAGHRALGAWIDTVHAGHAGCPDDSCACGGNSPAEAASVYRPRTEWNVWREITDRISGDDKPGSSGVLV